MPSPAGSIPAIAGDTAGEMPADARRSGLKEGSGRGECLSRISERPLGSTLAAELTNHVNHLMMDGAVGGEDVSTP